MTLWTDLESEVGTIFRSVWSERDGTVVPAPEDLKLGNDATKLDATVLYADMADSTKLVDNHSAQFAAEVYKAFLTCSARIVKANGGVITAYDGDRIMGVFIGGSKNTGAVRSALNINYAMEKIIKPKLAAQYQSSTFVPGHAVGVDTSTLLVARVGVRNDNDLVWVGRAANYAAKLCNLREGYYTSWITGNVFMNMNDAVKLSNGTAMWEEMRWTAMNNMQVYRSSWWSSKQE